MSIKKLNKLTVKPTQTESRVKSHISIVSSVNVQESQHLSLNKPESMIAHRPPDAPEKLEPLQCLSNSPK